MRKITNIDYEDTGVEYSELVFVSGPEINARLLLVRSDEGNGGWSLHGNPYWSLGITKHDSDAKDISIYEDINLLIDDIILAGDADMDDDSQEWNRPDEKDFAKAISLLLEKA